ncbi:MAG: hypothetical protein IPI85_08110 [Dehalococcoidia bacterium]|nr:hypothetical protein [Dehalococcoidia bacterium]
MPRIEFDVHPGRSGEGPELERKRVAGFANDIAAYGCTQTTGLSFFELGGSTAGSVFLDSQLTTAFSVSTSANGPAGGPTPVLAGGTTYVPGGVSQIRRFSVNNYPTTVTSRAAMPFLDLQCATDGVNSDNADGAGWNGQSFAADSQNYCIAYIWDGTTPTTPSPTPTATATPTQTPTPQASPTSTATASPAPSVTASASASPATTAVTQAATAVTTTGAVGKSAKVKVDVETWDEGGKGKWKPSSPGGQWQLALTDAKGTVVKTFTDAVDLDVEVSDYVVTFQGPAGGGTTSFAVVDFVLSDDGKSDCKEPTGSSTTLKLSAKDLERNGTVHACLFLKGGASTTRVTVAKSFVSAADGVVTWRLEPNQPADLLVWDTGISGCEEHEGAACGDITAGGYGKFYATAKGEYLLLTQKFKSDGDACKVTNTAEWATSDSEKRQSVTASYECSGASTMGWSLFALFATGAAGLAWVVQRKFACQQ